jgi:hypothetical protein
MNELYQPAMVRVSGPPNSSFLVGYPGISATLVSLVPCRWLCLDTSLCAIIEYLFSAMKASPPVYPKLCDEKDFGC